MASAAAVAAVQHDLTALRECVDQAADPDYRAELQDRVDAIMEKVAMLVGNEPATPESSHAALHNPARQFPQGQPDEAPVAADEAPADEEPSPVEPEGGDPSPADLPPEPGSRVPAEEPPPAPPAGQ